MRIGIGSYTFAWHAGVPGYPVPHPWTPDDLLDAAIALGAEVVQYCENLSLERLPDAALDRLRQRARAADIAVEVGTRGLSPARLGRCGDLARFFGSTFVRVVVDDEGFEPSVEETVERLEQALDSSMPPGVAIAIENHDRFSAMVLVDMVEAIGAERAGICLDTANSLGGLEGPAYVTETLAPYVRCLHLKDVRVRRQPHNMGFVVTGTALGEGQIDTPAVLEVLRAHGRDPNAIVELWPAPDRDGVPPLDRESAMARKSVAYLRTIRARALG